MMKKIMATLFALSLAISSGELVHGGESALYLMEEETTLTTQLNHDISVVQANDTTALAAYAASAVLMEQQTGRILFEKNATQSRDPASITKIMTMALVLEELEVGNLTYDEMVTASQHAKEMGGTQINLDVGEQMGVHDLLMAIAVASANDACVALAEHIGGGNESTFIDRMNKKAKELGMNDTTFKNSNGLPQEGHVTTAKDIALMSRYLLSFPAATEFIGTDRYPIRSGENEYMMRNSNALIREYDGSIGIKTGYTDAAGHCLSAAATRDDMTLIAVILGAPESKIRFREATALLDYGFSTYQLFMPEITVPTPASIPVKKGTAAQVSIAPPMEDITPQIIKRGAEPTVDAQFQLDEILIAPVEQGQKVGNFMVTIDGESIYNIDYVTSESVAVRTIFSSTLWILRNIVVL